MILFKGEETDPTDLRSVVGQAIGAGSACWENVHIAGMFDSERASQIVDEAVAWIERNSFLHRLRRINRERRLHWHPEDAPVETQWSSGDWSNAMMGEAGEAANVVKKIRRLETGVKARNSYSSFSMLVMDLGDELADMIIYADILAERYNIDLEAAIIRKFNAVSEREGFNERLA